jgi:hypothetical protein
MVELPLLPGDPTDLDSLRELGELYLHGLERALGGDSSV